MKHAAIRTPWHLWLVGVLGILFNAIGVFDFVMNMAEGPAYLARSGMTPEQVAHYEQMPVWMILVWAVGVFGALLASVLVLLRRALAYPVYVVSLAAYLISLFYHYGLTDGGALLGRAMLVMSVVITAVLLFLTGYARAMTVRGVLRHRRARLRAR